MNFQELFKNYFRNPKNFSWNSYGNSVFSGFTEIRESKEFLRKSFQKLLHKFLNIFRKFFQQCLRKIFQVKFLRNSWVFIQKFYTYTYMVDYPHIFLEDSSRPIQESSPAIILKVSLPEFFPWIYLDIHPGVHPDILPGFIQFFFFRKILRIFFICMREYFHKFI